MLPLSSIEFPAMQVPLNERWHSPPAPQHCAAMMISLWPGTMVTLSCSPCLKQARTLLPLAVSASPLSTRTPDFGMPNASDGGGDGEPTGQSCQVLSARHLPSARTMQRLSRLVFVSLRTNDFLHAAAASQHHSGGSNALRFVHDSSVAFAQIADGVGSDGGCGDRYGDRGRGEGGGGGEDVDGGGVGCIGIGDTGRPIGGALAGSAGT
mmetsp:Transcript_36156/g.84482  ORF Transcript_36156/g.84482 Transcript_36156/m.84482 type:complete len:209 (-) Transcript_36156:254-880(-)